MRLNQTKCILLLPVLLAAASQASAGCISPPLSDTAIAAFTANPASVLAGTPDMRALELSTRNLAAASSPLAQVLVDVAKDAKPEQQTAMAAGLAQAAMACLSYDVMAAQNIQTAVAGLDNISFQSTFAAIAGDLDTAAVNVATQAAAASTGSSEIVNPQRAAPTTTFGSGGNRQVAFTVIPISGLNLSRDAAASASSVSPVR